MAVVLLVGMLRAGSRFYYCEAMATVFLRPCCASSHHASDSKGAKIESRADDCCKGQTAGTLPSVAVPVLAPIPDAPLVAILHTAPAIQSVQTAALTGMVRRNPTGPPLRSRASERSRLMVFLI
jgi:hypothetical protein